MNTVMLNSKWDEDPEGYEVLRSSWLNERRDLLLKSFLTAAAAGEKILEIGAGTGASLRYLAHERPELDFVGLEPLDKYCAFAARRAQEEGQRNVRFVHGFAETLSSVTKGEGPYSFLVSTDVLHHVRDTEKAVEEIAKVSQPGARWLAVEPSWLNPYINRYQRTAPGERNFYPADFLRVAARHGWQLEHKRYLTLIPSFVKAPPAWLKAVERLAEGIPVLAGRVALTLRYEGH